MTEIDAFASRYREILREFPEIIEKYSEFNYRISGTLILERIFISQDKFENIEFYFEDGINLIHGEIGSGKTLFHEIIDWLFFGKKRKEKYSKYKTYGLS